MESSLPGDLILVHHTKKHKYFVLTDSIEWFSDSKYSHVAMSLGGDQIIESIWPGGVIIRNIDVYLNDDDEITVFRSGWDGSRAAAEAVKMIPERYALWQLCLDAIYFTLEKANLRKPIRWLLAKVKDPEGVTCAELVMLAYQRCGYLLDFKARFASPGLFTKLPYFKEIKVSFL